MGTEFPLITVIIATYNRRHYICDAIDSVLNQNYPNIELIVIDDGSSDGTSDLLQVKYGQRVHYIYQENKGRSDARNHGIRLAKGEYIAFLDSDDMWKPEKLTKQIEFMKSSPHYGLTHTFTEIIGEDGMNNRRETRLRLKVHHEAQKRGYTYEAMSYRCIMFLSTVIVRADAIQKIGWMDREIPAFEDWDWYLRTALVTKIGTLSEALTCYRRHDGNSTSAEFLIGARKTSIKHLQLCNSLPEKLEKRVKRNLYLHLAAVAYKEENLQECTLFLRQATTFDPWVLFWLENLRYTFAAYGSKTILKQLRWIKRATTGQFSEANDAKHDIVK